MPPSKPCVFTTKNVVLDYDFLLTFFPLSADKFKCSPDFAMISSVAATTN